MQTGNRVPFLTADIIKTSPDKREIHIYSHESDTGFEVEGYAAILCSRFIGDKSMEQLIGDMVAEFQLPENEFSADAISFASELESLNLIRWLDYPIS
jgi:hypothetical protein